jgi:hypothetical protein
VLSRERSSLAEAERLKGGAFLCLPDPPHDQEMLNLPLVDLLDEGSNTISAATRSTLVQIGSTAIGRQVDIQQTDPDVAV